jgi:hypothetical protein
MSAFQKVPIEPSEETELAQKLLEYLEEAREAPDIQRAVEHQKHLRDLLAAKDEWVVERVWEALRLRRVMRMVCAYVFIHESAFVEILEKRTLVGNELRFLMHDYGINETVIRESAEEIMRLWDQRREASAAATLAKSVAEEAKEALSEFLSAKSFYQRD